ncbi:type I restriction enzyme M protein [Entomoplasma ellychniae]|uniref:site-specific DNA-methyltransferase (adenine-specific) n=1 Tax=Entomoplasma ellychniae TaxID=2114 RepID=A0A8E2QWQ8_9MOLU|nr:N-6 DNA methylase [Entomoplasma ellychniae]PPE05091.1 type I restriction enzyme M protein [Entomoplasma ellychniae]
MDIIIYDLSNKPFWMIEDKDESEISKYASSSANINKIKQLISYYNQERETKFLSYFSFNFSSNKPLFATIKVTDRMKNCPNLEDIYDIWDKNFDSTDLFKINPYNLSKKCLKNNDLILIDNDDIVHNIFNQFLTILRINTVSDKPNSFDKLINLFIAKIYDELQDDINFEVNSNNVSYNVEGKRFQYLSKIDTPESFLIRLYDLYKNGMKYCLNKEIIDYTDDDFWELANKNNNQKLLKMFQNLRLKKDNTFAFIEVFDDYTFKNNFEIVKELVELLQKYKFKYNNKKQFLGDFFEELLNESWKQEAGQFFTPLPIVEMMTNALPIKENIQNKLLSTKIQNELLPKTLDYAYGSGHFLISSMDIIQKYIDNIDLNSIKIDNYKNKIQSYKKDKYSWAKEYVYGIEKDYRLSKTTKIASFLNGDGEANVLNADALLKFDSEIFNGTIFYGKKPNNEIFDYIISNPPYSVKGFMKNFIISGIKPGDGTFEFLNEINYKNTNIESFFLERTYQLLKNNGFASIVLPQSFLTNDKYSEIRSWMLEKFYIKSIFLSGPNTFSGTTTSPVILFLQKSAKNIIDLNYHVFVIHSPIMIDHNSLKLEKDFLGFYFSSNKNKKGITITNFDNLKNKLFRKYKKYVFG